jgi:hypothetical protein
MHQDLPQSIESVPIVGSRIEPSHFPQSCGPRMFEGRNAATL